MRSKPWPSTTVVVACLCALFLFVPNCVGFQIGSNSIPRQQQRRHGSQRRRSLTRGRESDTGRTSTTLACTPRGAEVALTREAGKNGKLATLLTEAGIASVEVPCIAHQDGVDLPLLPAALADPGLAYVVVTSPEAAKVFLAGWTKAGEPPVQVACVGKATGDALRAKGVTPVFTPSKATGETLAAEIPLVPLVPPPTDDAKSGGESGEAAAAAVEGSEGVESAPERRCRVLYPASAKAQKTLETGLQARGFEVRRLNTYDTVPASWNEDAKAAAAAATVAAFGSPSAVKTWAARMGVAAGVGGDGGAEGGGRTGTEEEGGREDAEIPAAGEGRSGALAACIGETSARACREAGWPESAIFYPEKPGMEGWAKAVGDALATVKRGASSATTSTVA